MLQSRNREKFIQAILYFAHHTASLGKIKLFKLLYLLDFEHFRQTGRSVTGLEYRAWKMGPVPAQLVQQWDALENDLAEAVLIIPERVIDYWLEKVVPLQPFDPEHFSKRELRILESLVGEHAESLSEKMVNVTHDDNGPWARVWANGEGRDNTIPYELAVGEDAPNREAVLQAASAYKAINAARVA